MMARNVKRRRVGTVIEGESLTHQSERTRADINWLVKRGIELPDPKQLRFGDFSDGTDFQTLQNTLADANASFDSLPSSIRDRFSNDPAELIDFIRDPDNADEAFELGLIESKPEPEIQNSDIKPSTPTVASNDDPSNGSSSS